MTTNEFKEYVKTRQALDTEEIHRFMDKMSNEARRITFRLNTAYHTPDEVRGVTLRIVRLSSPVIVPGIPTVLYRFREEYYSGRRRIY